MEPGDFAFGAATKGLLTGSRGVALTEIAILKMEGKKMAVETVLAESKSRSRRERGTGGIFKPKYRDRHSREMRESRSFWIQYRVNGQAVRENTRSDKISVAKQLLQRRIGEVNSGQWSGPKAEKTTVVEIMQALFRDYRINEAKSLTDSECRWRKHLEPAFGRMRAIEVTSDALDGYIDARKAEGAENGTINRELALLRRAFYIAYRSRPRKVFEVPNFRMLKENDPRPGFVSYEEYSQLCRACREPWLRSLIAAAYSFGFRVNELLSLRIRQIDLLARTIRLEPGATKNGKAREIKMTDEVYRLFCACVFGKSAEDFVFTRHGNSIHDFRWTWWRLCVRAGLGQLSCPRCSKLATKETERRCSDCSVMLRYSGTIFHDLRRSAVRNMVRSGIPRSVAMRISGHETESIFERYNIGSDEDLAEAARRIEEHQTAALNSHQASTKQSQSEQILAN
jgi:integrase